MKNQKVVFLLLLACFFVAGLFLNISMRRDVYIEKLNFTPMYYCSQTTGENSSYQIWGDKFCGDPIVLSLNCEANVGILDIYKKKILNESCEAIVHEMNMSNRFHLFIKDSHSSNEYFEMLDGSVDVYFKFRNNYQDASLSYGNGYFKEARVVFTDFIDGKVYSNTETSDGLFFSHRAAINRIFVFLSRTKL